jgi:hypothetical protein
VPPSVLFAGSKLAVRVAGVPARVNVKEVGDTSMPVTGIRSVTVTGMVFFASLQLTTMEVTPGPTAVTVPPDTVATAVLSLVHTNVSPVGLAVITSTSPTFISREVLFTEMVMDSSFLSSSEHAANTHMQARIVAVCLKIFFIIFKIVV